MIAGLEEPTQGTINIGDTDITTQKPYRRNVNTVFQNYALFPHLTIFENVAFGLRRRGMKDVKNEVLNALELVELAHLAERKPGQLSGGQQQRIAVARAIVNRPEVLLLDEPLGALDLKLRRQMQIELKRIQTEIGITFIHVTHDQEEAMTMADTIAVMNQGKIEQMGSATDLYEAPKTAFVANFLGQCNLIKAKVQSRAAGKAVVSAKGHTFEIPLSRVSTDSDSVLLGVRPEKLRLDDSGINSIKDCIVTDRSFVGTSTQYLLKTPWDLELIAFEQNDEGLHDLHVGDKVSVEWDPEHTFGLDGSQDINAGADLDEEE
jgi:spermidine/putrescine transport system ATP-binding protein